MLSLVAFLIIFLLVILNILARETIIHVLSKAKGRMINGDAASEMQFPFHAKISYHSERLQWSRGGTIISNQYILTTAHSYVTYR